MPFKVNARVLLQLGAELISSDQVAFYELIKNSFDAGSPNVNISVVIRMDFSIQQKLLKSVSDHKEEFSSSAAEVDKETLPDSLVEIRDFALEHINTPVSTSGSAFKQLLDSLRESIKGVDSWQSLQEILEQANYIEFKDSGEGMSIDDLEDIYLTIGTRSRLRTRESKSHSNERPVLGEKGLGRLSVMRLGSRLKILTTKKGESNYNALEVDWREFSHDSDALLEDIQIEPYVDGLKENSDASSTTIRVSNLSSSWSKEKLDKIAREEFSRLTDPFVSHTGYPIRMRFNGEIVPIPSFDDLIFSLAHAVVEAEFKTGPVGPRFAGRINFKLRNRETTFALEGAHLTSTSDSDVETLEALGPFSVKFYWYNRQILPALDGIGDRRQVQKLVNFWTGGLMVFRDGFRVYPYGNQDDDWLNLDPDALASGGYKVNRSQIIGKVDISLVDNPFLLDQTNREGLRNSKEKRAFIGILRFLIGHFRQFLNAVEKELQASEPIRMVDVEQRVIDQQLKVEDSLRLLKQQFHGQSHELSLVRNIENEVVELSRLMDQVKRLADSYEKGQGQLLHLAGLGLMVEILGHELNRVTRRTLSLVASGVDNAQKDPSSLQGLFNSLEAQLKTLQKRLQVLDPLDTNARQRKEKFDLVAWVREILQTHEYQFERHKIDLSVIVQPSSESVLRVNMVKGMVVQILENLISNSVYWLDQQRLYDNGFAPRIVVTINTEMRELSCWDNGPGVPEEMKETVFQPFMTTKPPLQGKGLGLFISREIASYHNGTLELVSRNRVHTDRLNTFVLKLGSS